MANIVANQLHQKLHTLRSIWHRALFHWIFTGGIRSIPSPLPSLPSPLSYLLEVEVRLEIIVSQE